MLITFTQCRRLSEDGHMVRQFHKGETVEVANMAAICAIRNGWAKCAKPQKNVDEVTQDILNEIRNNRGIYA